MQAKNFTFPFHSSRNNALESISYTFKFFPEKQKEFNNITLLEGVTLGFDSALPILNYFLISGLRFWEKMGSNFIGPPQIIRASTERGLCFFLLDQKSSTDLSPKTVLSFFNKNQILKTICLQSKIIVMRDIKRGEGGEGGHAKAVNDDGAKLILAEAVRNFEPMSVPEYVELRMSVAALRSRRT